MDGIIDVRNAREFCFELYGVHFVHLLFTHTHTPFFPLHTHIDDNLHSHTQSSVLWLPYWEIGTVPVISGIEHVKHRVSCGHVHKAKQGHEPGYSGQRLEPTLSKVELYSDANFHG
jgi:hypothetical protein